MKLKQKYFKKFFIGLSILFFFIVLVVILIFCFWNNSTVWKATSVITPIIVIIGITGLSFYVKKSYDHFQEKQNRTSEIQILKNKIYFFQKSYANFYLLFQQMFYKTKINNKISDKDLFLYRQKKVTDKLKPLNIEIQKTINNCQELWKFKFDLNDSLISIYIKCRTDSKYRNYTIQNLRKKFQLTNKSDDICEYRDYLLIEIVNKKWPFFNDENKFWKLLNSLLEQLNNSKQSNDFDFKYQIFKSSIDIKLIDRFINKLNEISNIFLFLHLQFVNLDNFDPENKICKGIMTITNRFWKILRFTWKYEVVEKYSDENDSVKLPKSRNNPDFMKELDKIYDELYNITEEISSPIYIRNKKEFLNHPTDNNFF